MRCLRVLLRHSTLWHKAGAGASSNPRNRCLTNPLFPMARRGATSKLRTVNFKQKPIPALCKESPEFSSPKLKTSFQIPPKGEDHLVQLGEHAAQSLQQASTPWTPRRTRGCQRAISSFVLTPTSPTHSDVVGSSSQMARPKDIGHFPKLILAYTSLADIMCVHPRQKSMASTEKQKQYPLPSVKVIPYE